MGGERDVTQAIFVAPYGRIRSGMRVRHVEYGDGVFCGKARGSKGLLFEFSDGEQVPLSSIEFLTGRIWPDGTETLSAAESARVALGMRNEGHGGDETPDEAETSSEQLVDDTLTEPAAADASQTKACPEGLMDCLAECQDDEMRGIEITSEVGCPAAGDEICLSADAPEATDCGEHGLDGEKHGQPDREERADGGGMSLCLAEPPDAPAGGGDSCVDDEEGDVACGPIVGTAAMVAGEGEPAHLAGSDQSECRVEFGDQIAEPEDRPAADVQQGQSFRDELPEDQSCNDAPKAACEAGSTNRDEGSVSPRVGENEASADGCDAGKTGSKPEGMVGDGRFHLFGFRSDKIWKRVIASIWYTLSICWLLFCLIFGGYNGAVMAILTSFVILVPFSYSNFGYRKKRHVVVRLLIAVLKAVLIVIACFFCAYIFDWKF